MGNSHVRLEGSIMRVLFLGYAVAECEANRLSGASISGNRMQLGLIKALLSQPEGVKVDALTVFPIAAFPTDSTLWVNETVIDVGDSMRALRVGFLNLPVVKQVMQALAAARAGMGMCRNGNYDIILTYNMYPQIGLAAWWIGRRLGIPVVSLLADLPIDDDPNRSWLSKVLMQVFNGVTTRLIRTCGAVIVLNECAAERYAPQAKRLVVDGAVDAGSESSCMRTKIVSGGTRRVVFTGALTQYNGVVELVRAMSMVRSEDLVLDIYGDGPLSELTREVASGLPNVNYYGRVESDAIAKIHRDAFLLINPRRIYDPISEVTFPSKILEYMLSGTPILTTKLNGFTDEYSGKLYFMLDGSPEGIARAIDDLAELAPDELRETGARARKFVIDERSWAARGPLIHRFLSEQVR
jgi:glycosyltransferase involved in cell wall biosynthesis